MAILKVKTDIIVNISVSSIRTSCDICGNVYRGLQNWHYCFYRWHHNVFYCQIEWKTCACELRTDLIFLWIKDSSVIQTLSAAHIKGKMSNLLINMNSKAIYTYLSSIQDLLSLVFCVMFCRLLFVCFSFFFFAIVLSDLLWFTASDYSIGIFKLFFSYMHKQWNLSKPNPE